LGLAQRRDAGVVHLLHLTPAAEQPDSLQDGGFMVYGPDLGLQCDSMADIGHSTHGISKLHSTLCCDRFSFCYLLLTGDTDVPESAVNMVPKAGGEQTTAMLEAVVILYPVVFDAVED
ncbi:hypothetical protein STEG23_003344, partial [Scotinomys teguina]